MPYLSCDDAKCDSRSKLIFYSVKIHSVNFTLLVSSFISVCTYVSVLFLNSEVKMRSAEELFSEVVQLRQMLSTTVEFKRILEMMFCEEAIATNKDVEKYSAHFEGALLKYRV